MSKEIIGILLAAGQSVRFVENNRESKCSNKLLQILPDSKTPIVVQAANHLIGALPNSIAVIPAGDDMLKSLLKDTGICVVENPQPKQGMSSSIRCGIETSMQNDADAGGWVIALADMPFIPVEIIKQVADAVSEGALMVQPEYHEQRGHPVGFSSQFKNELCNVQGDVGAKHLLYQYWEQVRIVEVSNDAILRDIDVPDDLLKHGSVKQKD